MPVGHRRFILWAILTLALLVRIWGIGFGLPFVHARPDELLVISTSLRFFTESLNPRFFDYPSLFLYLLGAIFALYYLWGRAIGWFENAKHFVGGTHGRWQALYLMGRAVSVVFGTLSVLWIYRLGAALFAESTGLIAAFFLSLAFLHVRDSHYSTTDITLCFFILWTMLWLARLHLDRRASHARWAGILAGFAMGTKYNAALLVVPMFVVEGLHAWQTRQSGWRVLRETYLPLMGVLMAVTFFLTTPYLLLDYQQAMRDFSALGRSMRVGMTPRDLLGPGWVYHVKFSLLYGVGLPLLVTGIGGIVVAAVRRPTTALLLASFPAAYYVVAGASADVFVRYMIPVVPFLCLFAAVAVEAVARWLAGAVPSLRPVPVAAVLAALVVAPSAWSVAQFDTLLSRQDSRVVAADWAMEHVPRMSTVYMTGNPYGHPPLEDRVDPKFRLIDFDRRSNTFVEKGRPLEELPDWIIVQRSALPYSHIADPIPDMLRTNYLLAHVIRAADIDEPRNVYDIQDAFYLPYGGFRGIRRPGPNLEFWARKDLPVVTDVSDRDPAR